MDTNKRDPCDAEANTTREGFLNAYTLRICSIIIKIIGDQCNNDSAATAVHHNNTEATATAGF